MIIDWKRVEGAPAITAMGKGVLGFSGKVTWVKARDGSKRIILGFKREEHVGKKKRGERATKQGACYGKRT